MILAVVTVPAEFWKIPGAFVVFITMVALTFLPLMVLAILMPDALRASFWRDRPWGKAAFIGAYLIWMILVLVVCLALITRNIDAYYNRKAPPPHHSEALPPGQIDSESPSGMDGN